MNLQIELFTTPTVDGRRILSSKGLVCVNKTYGAGVICEKRPIPSFLDTDRVESYHIELFESLENEVLKKGANAVVDLHIEHSYVHYVNSYYLLISAQGTAVVLEGVEIPINSNINDKVLEQQTLRKQILAKLKYWYEEYKKENFGKPRCYITEEEWAFICKYTNLFSDNDFYFADFLHLSHMESELWYGYSPCNNAGRIGGYLSYFKNLPYQKQIELAYKYISWNSFHIIVELNLFDAKHILEWATKGEYEIAIQCMKKVHKKEYSYQDLEDMQSLYEFFANLPEKAGSIEEIIDEKQILRLGRRYVFTCGHCNHKAYSCNLDDFSYCSSCRKNKRGLTEEQEEIIKEFGVKVETLKELLSGDK